jgi:hypothetical protein
MEPTKTVNARSRLLIGVSTAGMLIFAGLYLLSPKAATHTQTITGAVIDDPMKTVTKEAVREVPKVVERIVTVPADIPADYVLAMRWYRTMTNASGVQQDEVLFSMKDVCTLCVIDDTAKQVVTTDEVKAKWELTLRHNNVPINPHSEHVVVLSIDSFLTDNQQLFDYSLHAYVQENIWVFRGGDCHTATAVIWDKSAFGVDKKTKANEALLKQVEQIAELFANDYLSANPKPQ